MNYHGPSIQQIKEMADARRLEIVVALGVRDLPNGRGLIHISAPMRKDNHPSFCIWTHGGTLSFKDLATGEKGDVFDFVDYMQGRPKGHGASGEAIKWVKDFLGLRRMSEEERRAVLNTAAVTRQQEQVRADEDLARQRRAAFKLFTEDAAPLAGTLAHRYLKVRTGGMIDRLPRGPRGGDRMPHALRFHASAKHIWQGGKNDPRNGDISYWPCLIACCVDPVDWQIGAVHRTFLAANGSDKAPVKPPRKCFPAFAGLIIPIWRGASGLSVNEAIAAGLRETFQMGEGVEKSLAMAIAEPAYRTWAFISLSNLQNVKLPECCDGVIVHRDNEWDNGAAADAFTRGRAALEAQNVPVAEVRAASGKDFDDGLRD